MKIDNELQSRHAECIKLLIQHGADVNTVEKETGFTPVIVAAAVGYAEIVKLLLRAGADVMKTVEANGVNCIHFAATFGKLESIKVIYEYLVNNKDPEQIIEYMDRGGKDGITPLHCACHNGHEAVVKYLVNEIKVDVSKKTDNGETALKFAKDGGHKSIVSLLTQIQASQPSGQNVVTFAAPKSEENLVQMGNILEMRALLSDHSEDDDSDGFII